MTRVGGKKGKAKPAKKKEVQLLPKIIGTWVWAQCDNPGCEKWRKLPPGSVVSDTEPWFCYMNPNKDENDCNIPEEQYNVATEAAVYSVPPSEAGEEQPEDPDEPWQAADGLKRKRSGQKDRKGKKGRWESDESDWEDEFVRQDTQDSAGPRRFQRDRHDSPKSADAANVGHLLEAFPQDAQGREDVTRQREPLKANNSKTRRAHAGFNKLLSVGGVWEISKSKGKAVTIPPAFVWEALASHAPDGARIACQAADMSSAARYFEIAQAPKGAEQAKEASDCARLALTTAAALAIQQTGQIPGIPDSLPVAPPNNGSKLSPGLPEGYRETSATAAQSPENKDLPSPAPIAPAQQVPQTQANGAEVPQLDAIALPSGDATTSLHLKAQEDGTAAGKTSVPSPQEVSPNLPAEPRVEVAQAGQNTAKEQTPPRTEPPLC